MGTYIHFKSDNLNQLSHLYADKDIRKENELRNIQQIKNINIIFFCIPTSGLDKI